MQSHEWDNPELVKDMERDGFGTVPRDAVDLALECARLEHRNRALNKECAAMAKGRAWLIDRMGAIKNELRTERDLRAGFEKEVARLQRELDHADANGPAEPTYVAGDLI